MDEHADRVRDYYDSRGESEWHRLSVPFDAAIEWEMHARALGHWLSAGSRVLDLGGGPGRWTIWLARHGHRVSLGDLSPGQLAIARREVGSAGVPVDEIAQVDARDLSRYPDGWFDAILAFGPFYHLVAGEDRRRAAGECRRVLRPGGRLFATAMMRYAWAVEILLTRGSQGIEDARRVLAEGAYSHRAGEPFTDAYLHTPGEVAPFFEEAGFSTRLVMASEGGLNLARERAADAQEHDPGSWPALMDVAYQAAADPSILGLSAHVLYIGDVA